jgi:hypothetical protein
VIRSHPSGGAREKLSLAPGFEVPGEPAVDESIPEKTIHEWLSLGVRGRFDL